MIIVIVLDLHLSREEYEVTESTQQVRVGVCKDQIISVWSYLFVRVLAETVESANASGVSLPEIPADNPYAPNRAG